MNFSKEMMASINADDLAGIKAELIGCLDEDMASHEMPKTLALAEALAVKLPSDLFEKDNGHYDFASASMDKENLREIKARLRINFSKEKLDFACRIVAYINGFSDSTTARISDKCPIDTPVAVLQPETKPIQKVAASELPSSPSTLEPANTKLKKSSEVTAVQQVVSTHIKTEKEKKVQTKHLLDRTPTSEIEPDKVGTSQSKQPQMPEMPSAPKPDTPSFDDTKTPTQSTSRVPHPRGQAEFGQQPTPKRPKVVRMEKEPGCWERLFQAVGRRIDEFLERLFGPKNYR